MKDRGLDMTDEDRDLAALIRAAGPLARPAAGAAAEVRSALQSEWRDMLATRRRRRTFMGWAAAAGVGFAALTLWTARPLYLPAGDPLATLARVEGQVEYRDGSSGDWTSATFSLKLKAGDRLRTGRAGRVALTLGGGLDIRLDSGTQLALVDSGHVALAQGALYLDSGNATEARANDLQVGTPLGDVSHLGTQYEARLDDGTLQVAVREGRVKVGVRGVDVLAKAGEQIRVADTVVSRTALPTNSDQWSWVSAITPPFPIEGKSVADFLSWAARETGRSVEYSSPEVARQARGIVLRGSITGLTPDQAVGAVLSTTPLRPEILGDRIRVEGSAL
jgi:ferric-dicitrate binding protein FerR (iron transport regulator)